MPTQLDTPIIVALDFSDTSVAIEFAKKLSSKLCRVKVGKELFTAGGPEIVDKLHNLGLEVFLDLKFHDIPKTVEGAVKQAASMGVWMVNVHASGGGRMLVAAKDALANAQVPPLLIAVTVLTSMEENDLREVGVEVSMKHQVQKLAKLAKSSGCDGVVCSAQEATMIRHSVGEDFTLVSPGIRLSDGAPDDQRRIVTPLMGFLSGVDYLVLGRSITKATDPLFELEKIYSDLKSARREC